MRSILRTCAAVVVLGAACNDVTGPEVYVAQEPFTITLPASGATQLRLTGISGNTTVRGVAAADSVRITGVREVGSRESVEDATMRLDGLQVQSGVQGNAIVVNTVQPSNQEGRSYTVDYDVTLPRHFALVLVTANGEVHATSMENTVDLNLANGTAILDDIVGDLFVTIGNGTALCEAELPLNGTFDLGVGNGEIGLTMPTNTSAQFTATVASGDIRIVSLELQDLNRTQTHVSGRLGSGQGTIRLGMGNGTITATGR